MAHLAAELRENVDDELNHNYSYELGLSNKGLNAVFEYLLDIPALRPLSIWWVILLLASLAVLLGPVDYIVLKRLDRQPLTWLTSAGWIVLFTVCAYYGVQMVRDGTTQVMAVSVLDAVEGDQSAWSTTYMGVFAPDSGEYELENLGPGQWWSGISPSQENQYMYGRDSASKTIDCLQYDGGNIPAPLPINIWTMQCMMNESPANGEFPLTATVERTGDRGEQLIVTVTNRSDRPIKSGCVRLDEDMVMKFDSVDPGQTKQFQGWPHKRQYWGRKAETFNMWNDDDGRFDSNSAFFARGSLRRTRAIEAYLAEGAAVVCAKYDHPAAPFPVANRKSDDTYLQLVRLVVFPTEEQTK